MDKNGSVIGLYLLLLFMIVLSGADAFNSRKLVAILDPNGANQVCDLFVLLLVCYC